MDMQQRIECCFWPKVEKTETCWLWTASRTNNGYGKFFDGTTMVLAHRFAYDLLVRPIPDGLTLDHLCRVRHCVNPAHLEPVTMRDNLMRGEGPATRCRNTHCIHGHLYDEANTIRQANGTRKCRTCRLAYMRRLYLRQKAAKAA